MQFFTNSIFYQLIIWSLLFLLKNVYIKNKKVPTRHQFNNLQSALHFSSRSESKLLFSIFNNYKLVIILAQ